MKHCLMTDIGSYDCYESSIYGFNIDACLLSEVEDLNNLGTKTIGSCCGHNKLQGYIQVAPEYVDSMLSRGYEQLSLDKYGRGSKNEVSNKQRVS